MLKLTLVFVGFGLIVQSLIGLAYFISSIAEKEYRASVFGGLQFAAMVGVVWCFLHLASAHFYNTKTGSAVLIGALLISVAAAYLILRRESNPKALQGTHGYITQEAQRFDERDQVFARNRSLRPDSDQYRAYYDDHREYENGDSIRRMKGGPLGQPGTIDKPREHPNIAATFASLSVPMHLSTTEKFSPRPFPLFIGQRASLSAQNASQIVKGCAQRLGADMVGITEINPLWVYSHRGEIFHENWNDWGRTIELDHTHAVVFGTEMSLTMVRTAPHTPTTIESMGNYAKGAYIATQLAAFIANLGYSATANHVRHYDLLLVPLAVDAGLGETGRLGYLMTKRYGPRVRLAAVTTDLPLVSDKPVDIGVEDFCRFCKKCAVCCPSGSIPMGDPFEVNGTVRWKLKAETCFDYWGKVGTDCNVCMRVCPWSHANTFPHKIIRTLIARNRLSRRVFSLMDDIFYGKKPKPKAAPKWAQLKES